MQRGFSLLEVVLAVAILGGSMCLLFYFSSTLDQHAKKEVQEIFLLNTQRNTQNLSLIQASKVAI